MPNRLSSPSRESQTKDFVMLQITPLPGAWPQKPGSATLPFFGVQVSQAPGAVQKAWVQLSSACLEVR
jgi:hypothetical protein